MQLPSGVHRFKISDAAWSGETNLGGASPGIVVRPRRWVDVVSAPWSHDLVLDLENEPPGVYRFILSGGPKLRVERMSPSIDP
jgi:hypothetical protein